MSISFPQSFWLVNMWKYATKQVFFHNKIEKQRERQTQVRKKSSFSALNPRPEEMLQFYKKLTKEGFQVQSF